MHIFVEPERATDAPLMVSPMNPTTALVVVAIVTFNNAEHIARLVDSIRADPSLADRQPRILVIDNASQDATVEIARTLPHVTVVETGGNLGYSGAINVARAQLDHGEALAILNPDLVLAPGALDALVQALDDSRVGIAAPLLREPDGSVYPHLRRETSIVGSLGDALIGARWASRPRWLSDTLRRHEDYRTPHDIAWAGGAALLISAECNARIGDWDEQTYFLYSEETDYARRARDAGYLVRFVPSAEATHIGGASGQPRQLLALMAVNRIRYFEKHHGPVASASFRSVVALHHGLRGRDPRHRFAARTVCSRSSWSALPSASRTGDAAEVSK